MTVQSSDKPFITDLTDGRELVINGIATSGYWGGQHVMCLSTNRAGAAPDGTLRSETVIVARLRFDNEMAKLLRAAIDQQIKSLEAPSTAAN